MGRTGLGSERKGARRLTGRRIRGCFCRRRVLRIQGSIPHVGHGSSENRVALFGAAGLRVQGNDWVSMHAIENFQRKRKKKSVDRRFKLLFLSLEPTKKFPISSFVITEIPWQRQRANLSPLHLRKRSVEADESKNRHPQSNRQKQPQSLLSQRPRMLPPRLLL